MNETIEAKPGVGQRRLRAGAVLAVAIAVGFIAWLVFVKNDDNNGSSSAKRVPAHAASVQELRQFAASAGHPVYWVGNRPSQTYELTQTSDGSIYIRYLPASVRVGDSRPNFLTVGTYPHPNATATIEKASKRPGAVTKKIRGGGLAVTNKGRPRSVYVAYPGSELLLEVYDPSPRLALDLATSGRVVPIH
jgi:hypothetical protein